MPSRVVTAGLVVLATLLVVRVGVAPAETCPSVTEGQARDAAARAVAWLGANQHGDGTFAYQLDDDGTDLGGYNITRHAGVLLSLYQAAGAGLPDALRIGDHGLEWALDRVEPAGAGRGLGGGGRVLQTGASALLAAALVERRLATGDATHDEVLDDLTAFLAGTVESTGAVPAEWDAVDDRAVPGRYSKYSTGEVLWALARAAHPATAAVAAYLPSRDGVEDRFPPTSDHWAAYAWAELAASGTPLSSAQLEHARRLAGILGVQVRSESTRWSAGGPVRWLRQGPASGSGLGTLGEGTAALLRLFGDGGADGLTERAACVAGMLVERQADGPGPAQRGAWFAGGVTRMDDQQHALSALLAAGPALAAAGDAAPVGGGEDPWGLLVVAIAFLAATNPARTGSDPNRTRVVAVAGLAAAAVVAALSGPIADALSVSPASVRLAAGIVLLVVSVVGLVAPRGAWSDGLALATTAVVALAAGVDNGTLVTTLGAVPAAVAVGWLPERWRRPAVARATAAAGVVVAVGLVVGGALGV